MPIALRTEAFCEICGEVLGMGDGQGTPATFSSVAKAQEAAQLSGWEVWVKYGRIFLFCPPCQREGASRTSEVPAQAASA